MSDDQTTGPVWRDRGTIIANQQARIAELEAACQRLRDDYQGALAERDEARAKVEASAAGFLDAINLLTIRLTKATARAEAAEADAAGLRARMLRLADQWADKGRSGRMSGSGLIAVTLAAAAEDLRAALAAEPTPAAEPHAEDGWSDCRICRHPAEMHGPEVPGCVECRCRKFRSAPVADPDDTKDGQR